MEPSYDWPDVRDLCERHGSAVARLGQEAAAELQTAMADFSAAETAVEFVALYPERFTNDGPHGLVMTLRCGLRLQFVSGHPIKKGQLAETTDWAKTSRLRVVAIEASP